MDKNYREANSARREGTLIDPAPSSDEISIERYKLRILQENARDGGFALLMACISYAALLVNYIDATLVMPWLMVSVAIVAIRFHSDRPIL